MHEIRYAFRMLLKAPAMSGMAVVTLALGIGTTSAIFSLVNAALLRPLPGIGDPDHVVTIGGTIDGEGFDNSGYPNYVDLREQNTVFTDVAALKPLPLSLGTGHRAVRLTGALVTPNYFRTLGVSFAMGRPLPEGRDPAGEGSPVAVISHAVWAQHFGRDPKIVGKAVSVNGQPFEIVGVAARAFRGTDPTAPHDIWLPLFVATTLPGVRGLFRDIDWFQTRKGIWIMLYARLKPTMALERARADVAAVAQRLRRYPENEKFGWEVVPGVGLQPEDRALLLRLAGLLFAGVGLLYLLACANAATLTLSRMAARGREMSVRLALGASRLRVARQLLIESVLLSLVAGAAGLLVAVWVGGWMSRLFGAAARFPLALDLSPDLLVLAFTFLAACLAGVLVGVAPALHSARAGPMAVLKESAGATRRSSLLRRGLVVAQLALSIVLLATTSFEPEHQTVLADHQQPWWLQPRPKRANVTAACPCSSLPRPAAPRPAVPGC
jgi:predicted permease